MTILFICASLEPGRDGVGDYTRKLALHLEQECGMAVGIIAWRDKYITVTSVEETVADSSIRCLRIPSGFSSNKRLKEAMEFIDASPPEWISLQYVPYGYHSRGIPLILPSVLERLYTSARWHLMVHEAFVGGGSGIKSNVIQFLQKRVLKQLVQKLNPVVHTTIPRYRDMLQQIAVNADLLPLFGNISIERVLPKIVKPTDAILTGVYFGAVPMEKYHAEFANGVAQFCKKHNQKIHIVICGRSGSRVANFVRTINQYTPEELCKITVRGALDAAELSQLFSTADFGIARVPPWLIGKSGSAIAMLEHGLPLWIPLPGGKLDDASVFRPELCFAELDKVLDIPHAGPKERIPLVAKKLIKALALPSTDDHLT